MSSRLSVALSFLLLLASCNSSTTEAPPPPKSESSQIDAQVAELLAKITKWQTNRDKLKRLLGQMQKDKTVALQKLLALGVTSENDLANNPKAQILYGELKDIIKQIAAYEKKYQDYDLAILKSESRVRSVVRQAAAREAGVSDKELEELTRSMVTLDESLASEEATAFPLPDNDILKQEIARYQAEQKASPSGSPAAESAEGIGAAKETAASLTSPSGASEVVPAQRGGSPQREIPLFNGRDLDGWSVVYVSYSKSRSNTSWRADPAKGVLACTGGDFNELRTNGTFKDFTLRLEWRFTPGGSVGVNGSGIVVRSNGLGPKDNDPQGIEIDLRPKNNEAKGMGTGCFIAYGTSLRNHKGEADEQHRHLGWLREPEVKGDNQWNICEISCKGDRIRVTMNGVLVNEGCGAEAVSGRICLRNQNTAVEFRNIRLIPGDDGSGPATKRPAAGRISLVEVPELKVYSACFTEDGLTICFDRGTEICIAHRKDVYSPFEKEQVLFEGRLPAITGDGLEVVFVNPDAGCFYSATRPSAEQPFGRPMVIPEFRGSPDATAYPRNPSFAANGLTLYFQRYDNGQPELAFATRPDRCSPWSKPQPLPLKDNELSKNLTAPSVTGDGMTLFCVTAAASDLAKRRGNLLKFTRSRLTEPFGNPQFVELEGIPRLLGRFPRYVPATKELFFMQSDEGQFTVRRLIVIKDFVP